MIPLLYRLADGSHIFLHQVSEVTPKIQTDAYGNSPRAVVIVCRGPLHQAIDFPTLKAAQTYADELAPLVNEARAAASSAYALPSYKWPGGEVIVAPLTSQGWSYPIGFGEPDQ